MPYKKIDCGSVSAEGWHGTSLSAYIHEFLGFSQSGFGVLHLDELDKIGVSENENQESKRELQLGLLDLLDGDYRHMHEHRLTESKTKLDNINNCLLILSGSFQSHRNESIDKKLPIGFKNDSDSDKPDDKTNWKDKMNDLGFLQEFAARIVHTIELEKYSTEQIKKVITDTEESAYMKYKNLFGYDKTLQDSEIDEIVKNIESNKNGLRELDSLLFQKYYDMRRKK